MSSLSGRLGGREPLSSLPGRLGGRGPYLGGWGGWEPLGSLTQAYCWAVGGRETHGLPTLAVGRKGAQGLLTLPLGFLPGRSKCMETLGSLPGRLGNLKPGQCACAGGPFNC